MKRSIFQRNRLGLFGFVLSVLITALVPSSCQRDFNLDKEMPEWLGESIYDYLKEGGYDTYVKLIEDLNYKDILSRTGSKTLFVADEDAVKRFYASGVFKKANGEPVSCYEDLSLAQKKMILYGSMLNNVFQVAMLSSSEGPVLGDCMRRLSSSAVYDTVMHYVSGKNMPTNKYFDYYNGKNGGEPKDFYCLRDASVRPMVFFVNKFLVKKKIRPEDYDFLFNQGNYADPSDTIKSKRFYQPGDASVNGVFIKKQNIKCFNGFVHEMEDVIYSLPNMAEYLSTSEDTKIYYALLERFCAPYYSEDLTREFKRLYPQAGLTDNDSVFELHFFSARSRTDIGRQNQGVERTPTPKGGTFKLVSDLRLKFDPTWNAYYSHSTSSAEVALQQDMGLMIVPTDEAMTEWWLRGPGYPLKERYGNHEKYPLEDKRTLTIEECIDDMKGIEDYVILRLLNNNMLQSFVSSVPTKFADVLDDAQDPMGIETADVDRVNMCCNGGIYITNKVFSPASYRSVSFPTLVNEKLRVINWAVGDWVNGQSTGCGFFAYLNSMHSTYSFFVPSVEGAYNAVDYDERFEDKLVYIDPVSFGTTKSKTDSLTRAFVFEYDQEQKKVTAMIYNYDLQENRIVEGATPTSATDAQIIDRLSDLLDYHIVIGDVDVNRDSKFYQTKGRGTILLDKGSDGILGEGDLVYGGYNIERNLPSTIKQVYDMTGASATGVATGKGNGKTYILDRPLTSSLYHAYDILSDSVNYPEFREFSKLMNWAGLYMAPKTAGAFGSAFNISVFNTFHYTLYVPRNESVRALINAGKIFSPELEDVYNDLNAYVVAECKTASGTSITINPDVVFNKFFRAYSLPQGEAGSIGGSDRSINNPNIVKAIQDTIAFQKEMLLAMNEDATIIADFNTKADSVKYADFLTQTKNKTKNFLKHHIQDNSLYIGGETNLVDGRYETSFMNKLNTFERLHAVPAPAGLTIEYDQDNTGVYHKSSHVLTDDPKYYNIMCRDYEYKVESNNITELETSSYSVIHLIDEAFYSDNLKY